VRVLRDLYDRHLARYAADGQAARLVAKVGGSPPAPDWDRDPGPLAALTSICRVLLNTNETITRY
jgi:hypothetical protein